MTSAVDLEVRVAVPEWLVSPRFDLLCFGLPAAVALALVPLGPILAPSGETPFPMWVVAVLAVDVAHVWATLYRSYLDPRERRRLGGVLLWVPLIALVSAGVLASQSLALFWRILAYVAVHHFVRQQDGWIKLLHRKDPTLSPVDRGIDRAAIYAATLYPVLWWHAHLPRGFEWFMPGDFVPGLPERVPELLFPGYLLVLLLFLGRHAVRALHGQARPGVVLVVSTTALCWGIGILVTDTDWAFTVTNVLIHGLPYFGFVWVVTRRSEPPAGTLLAWLASRGWAFYLFLLVLAVVEEIGWDLSAGSQWVVVGTAFFSVPQITHYVLDGVIWRRRPAMS